MQAAMGDEAAIDAPEPVVGGDEIKESRLVGGSTRLIPHLLSTYLIPNQKMTWKSIQLRNLQVLRGLLRWSRLRLLHLIMMNRIMMPLVMAIKTKK